MLQYGAAKIPLLPLAAQKTKGKPEKRTALSSKITKTQNSEKLDNKEYRGVGEIGNYGKMGKKSEIGKLRTSEIGKLQDAGKIRKWEKREMGKRY